MKIVGISGSPSATSRTCSLLQHVRLQLQPVAASFHSVSVRELPAEALLHADGNHPTIRRAIDVLLAADAVIIATPIYKAAYSGILKAFLDLVPSDALRGKTVLPIATGGSLGHLLALDYALKPVLSALGARDILDPVFAVDDQVLRGRDGEAQPSPELSQRIATSLAPLLARGAQLLRRTTSHGAAAPEHAAFLARIHAPVHQEIQ